MAALGLWVPLHQSLREHPKVFTLADNLDIDNAHALGLVASLWLWSINGAPDGVLPESTRVICEAAGWTGDRDQLIDALVAAGFVDKRDGQWHIHDWDDYVGRLRDARQKNADDQRKSRERQAAKRAAQETRSALKNATAKRTNLPQSGTPAPDVRPTNTVGKPYVRPLQNTTPHHTRKQNTTTPSHIKGESEGDGPRPEGGGGGGGGDDGKEEIRELLLKAGSKMQEDWKSINPLLDGAWFQNTANKAQGRATRRQLGIIIQQNHGGSAAAPGDYRSEYPGLRAEPEELCRHAPDKRGEARAGCRSRRRGGRANVLCWPWELAK